MPKVLSVEDRREKGVPHEQKSVELFNAIRRIDGKYGGDFFDWRAGGDGDNGEHLMYLLDIHFNPSGKPPRKPRPCIGAACDGDCDDLSCDADK